MRYAARNQRTPGVAGSWMGKGFSPKFFRGLGLYWHLISNEMRINFCGFKLPHFDHFVKVSPGNEYSFFLFAPEAIPAHSPWLSMVHAALPSQWKLPLSEIHLSVRWKKI
jgi:hypothetical protein